MSDQTPVSRSVPTLQEAPRGGADEVRETQSPAKPNGVAGPDCDTSTRGGEPQQDDDSRCPKQTSGACADSDSQAIFDERFDLFLGPLVDQCDAQRVVTAIAVVVDPKNPKEPLVLVRGREYDAAILLARILRKLQQQVMSQITP